MRGAWFGAAPAALVLLGGCSYAIIRGGELNQSAARTIQAGVAEMRQLSFRTPVPMEVKSAEELKGFLRDELGREYTPEELADLGRTYERLGLLAPGTNFAVELIKLYGAQVAGFYDPHVGKLFLVPSGVPSPGFLVTALQFLLRRDLVNEMLLAHELTHALQDQNFAILALADDPSDDDRALAVRAVLEGDATLSGFAYIFGGLPETSLLDLVDRLQAIPAEVAATMPDAPPILREALIFQYSTGSAFVARAYLHGGWRAVNALLRHPPTSTEQVLRPEKYFTEPDTPTRIDLGGLDDYRGASDWRLLEENTLGELAIRILGEGFIEPGRAVEAARGWDGDRFAAFARGNAVHLFWMSAWDSAQDAQEFFAAEAEVLAKKWPGTRRESEASQIRGEGEEPYWLERREGRVLVVLGVSPTEAKRRSAEVWARTSFAPQQLHIDLDLARGRFTLPSLIAPSAASEIGLVDK